VQIGVRMVLPIIALLAISLAVAVVRHQQLLQGWPRRLSQSAMAALLFALASSSALVWPHGLCYANALWGGSETSYVVVSDSNFDWGQGVPDLLSWREQQGLDEIDVWYFGADPAIHEPPLRNLSVHTQDIGNPVALMHAVKGRYLAVGATIVYGGYISPETPVPAAQVVAYLRSQRPIAQAGPLLIYDLAHDSRWAQVQQEKVRLAQSTTQRSPQ
jgi:hypothetical protein